MTTAQHRAISRATALAKETGFVIYSICTAQRPKYRVFSDPAASFYDDGHLFTSSAPSAVLAWLEGFEMARRHQDDRAHERYQRGEP